MYGSVGLNEIYKAFQDQNIEISKREIILPEGQFYAVGSYVIELHLHSDVIVSLNIEIVSVK